MQRYLPLVLTALIFAICVLPSAVGQSCSGNLLRNASFDSLDLSWKSSGPKIIAGSMVFCNTIKEITQYVPAEVGKKYFAYVHGTAVPNAAGAYCNVTLTFRAQNWSVVSHKSYSVTLPYPYALTETAPPGAQWVQLTIGYPINGCGYIDAVCMTASLPCVNDIIPPSISNCPASLSAFSFGATPIPINWTEPTVQDNCPGAQISGNHMSGDTFPMGTTQVIYTATDASQNTKTCQFAVTVKKSSSECSGNIVINPDFDADLNYWQSNQATIWQYSPSFAGATGIDLCSADSYFSQRLAAKPFHSYQLSAWHESSKPAVYQISFLDSLGNLLGGQPIIGDDYLRAESPAATHFIEVKVSGTGTSVCALVYSVCMTEVPAAGYYANTFCPMLTLQGGYDFIGYDSTGLAELSKRINTRTWEICTLDSLGQVHCRIDSLPYEHKVIVKDMSLLVEINAQGDTVKQQVLPLQVTSLFNKIDHVLKAQGAYYMVGRDATFPNPQITFVRLDTSTHAILAQKSTYFSGSSHSYSSGNFLDMKKGAIGHQYALWPQFNSATTSNPNNSFILDADNLDVISQGGELTLVAPYAVHSSAASQYTGNQGYRTSNSANWVTRLQNKTPTRASLASYFTASQWLYTFKSEGNLINIAPNGDTLRLYTFTRYGDYLYPLNVDKISHLYHANASGPIMQYPQPMRHTKRVYIQLGSRIVELEYIDTTTTLRTLNCLATPAPPVCTPNILANGSFHNDLQGWQNQGAAWLSGNAQLCQTSQTLTQTLPAVAGKHYRFHYTARTLGTGQNILFGLKFLDANWAVLGTEYSSFDSPGTFSSNYIQATAPASARWIEAAIIKENNGCIEVSEVCLSEGTMVADESQSREDDNSEEPSTVELTEPFVYPNPSATEVEVRWSGQSVAQVTLIEPSGRVMQQKQGMGSVHFDLSNCAEGMYYVRVHANGEQVNTVKLCVMR